MPRDAPDDDETDTDGSPARRNGGRRGDRLDVRVDSPHLVDDLLKAAVDVVLAGVLLDLDLDARPPPGVLLTGPGPSPPMSRYGLR